MKLWVQLQLAHTGLNGAVLGVCVHRALCSSARWLSSLPIGRTAVLLGAACQAGAEWVVENPSDRGDPSQPWLFQVADHGPIWLDPHMISAKAACSAEHVTFAQCMFGADTQKYSTFWFTPGLSEHMRPLSRMVCSHAPGTHSSVAGGVQNEDGSWNSAATAASPARTSSVSETSS